MSVLLFPRKKENLIIQLSSHLIQNVQWLIKEKNYLTKILRNDRDTLTKKKDSFQTILFLTLPFYNLLKTVGSKAQDSRQNTQYMDKRS